MIPFVVMEAEVAAMDISVFGVFPSTFPATAFIPICAPILGLYATLGIMVTGDFFLDTFSFFFEWKILENRSPTSYWVFKESFFVVIFNESEGWTWA